MPISVLVNGAFGRMGQIACKSLNDDPKFALVGQTGRDYDLVQAIQDSKADVVIDFTHPEVVFENAQMIIKAGSRPVIGTTGLTSSQIESLQQECKEQKRGGIIAPNFSLSAILMLKYAKEIAKYLPNVEIIELHHAGKIDSPSGTALHTAELLSEARQNKPAQKQNGKETVAGARGATYRDIPIHSIRLPGLLAHEEIIFGNSGETLRLRHDTIDRECFMPGLMLACEKVMVLKNLVYGLEEIL